MIFYLKNLLPDQKTAVITGSDVHHIRVLRMKVGDPIVIRNFSHRQYDGEITLIRPDRVKVRLVTSVIIPNRSLSVWLYLGVPKISILKILVRQLTELGVAGVQLVLMEHSDVAKKDISLDKLKKISLEAMKQCLLPTPMILPPVMKFGECDIDKFCGAKKYLADEKALYEPFYLSNQEREDLRTRKKTNNQVDLIELWVGPEGGITASERELILSWGFQSVSLSPQILRVDTAVLFLLAKII